MKKLLFSLLALFATLSAFASIKETITLKSSDLQNLKIASTDDANISTDEIKSENKIIWKFIMTKMSTTSFYIGSDNIKGLQFGSETNPNVKLTITSNGLSDKSISKVTVNLSCASSGSITASVRVGDTFYQYNNGNSYTLTTTSTDVSFARPKTAEGALGEVTISLDQPTTSKAMYIKSITVEYDEVGDGPKDFTAEAFKDYTIEKDEMVDLVLPDNAPEITYTSSDKSIAEVLEGTIMAYEPGTVTITATWDAVTDKWNKGTAEFTVTVVSQVPAQVYSLVEKDSDIYDGGVYLLVGMNNNKYYAMCQQNGAYREISEVTVDNKTITIKSSDNSSVAPITLEKSGNAGQYLLKVSDGYLQAPSSNGVNTTESGTSFTLKRNDDNKVDIQGNSRYMRFNFGSSPRRVACYTSGQVSGCLYKLEESLKRFAPDAFKDYVIAANEMVKFVLPEGAPAVTYESSRPDVAEVELEDGDCTIYAYKRGVAEITASWLEVEGQWKAGTAKFTVTVSDPYENFFELVTQGTLGEVAAAAGNFSVLYQAGNYLMLTDGASNLLIYGKDDTYEVGTKISSVIGSVNFFNSLFELIDVEIQEGGEGATYDVKELTTLEGLTVENNLFDQYTLKGANITNKNSSKSTATITLGSESITLFDAFKIDYNNGENADITGFIWRNKDGMQFAPTSVVDGDVIPAVKMPVISPNKRELQVGEKVTITCETEGATIYYTVDGSEPTQESMLYSAPFIFEGVDFTVKARAYYEGDDVIMFPSEIAEKEYHIFNPYCNVIDNSHGTPNMGQYVRHTCTVDGVDYAMVGIHDKDKGIQMNNKTGRFCYIIQTGDNAGLALESIEVDFNSASTNDVTFTVRGSNVPFSDGVVGEDGIEVPANNITTNGENIGEISKESRSVTFKRDYNYFAFYPAKNGVVYMNSITIKYRKPKTMEAAPVIPDNFADYFESKENGTLIISNIPGDEDWIAYYQINGGENDSEVREAVTGDEGNLHEGLEAATLHTVKIWYEHYYYGEKSTVYVFNHVTQPQFGNLVEDREAGKTTFSFGTIGEGVNVYFTLNDEEPKIPATDEAPVNVIRRANVNGSTYVIDRSEDLNNTHGVTSATPQIEIAHGIVTDKSDYYTLKAVAVHNNGTRSSATVNDQIPTSIKEVSAVNPSDNAVYDLMGRKVAAPVRGLYIQNGTKRFVR